MSNQTIVIDVETKLITEECCNCGVLFALPEGLRGQLLKTGNNFYCPAGHPQHYTNSTEGQLRKANELLREERAYAHTLHKQREEALKEISNKKRVITRMKNRIHNGVCPECHRHFENLERHMKTKHGGKQ